jgi:hypothetical protein
VTVSGGDVGDVTLRFALDGGAWTTLRNDGPDGRRLERAGDFNAEIDFDALDPGPNEVVIEALHGGAPIGTRTVTLTHEDTGAPPLPYEVDWSDVERIDEVGHVVDGLWEIQGDTVRAIEPGYDRLLALGDWTWTDYEVEAEVTVNELYAGNFGQAVGFILRWRQHVVAFGETNYTQPRDGYYPLGALPIYDFNGGHYEIQGSLASHPGTGAITNEPSGATLVPGVTYVFRATVETIPGEDRAVYSFEVCTTDPVPDCFEEFEHSQEDADGTVAGSVLLLAHNVDASFGSVSVRPLE